VPHSRIKHLHPVLPLTPSLPTCAALLSSERQLQQVLRHPLAVKAAKQQHIAGPWSGAAATSATPAAATAVCWLGPPAAALVSLPAAGCRPLLPCLLLHCCVAGCVGTARHTGILCQHPAPRPPIKNEYVAEQAAVSAAPAVHQQPRLADHAARGLIVGTAWGKAARVWVGAGEWLKYRHESQQATSYQSCQTRDGCIDRLPPCIPPE